MTTSNVVKLLAAGALARTPLGELTALPQTPIAGGEELAVPSSRTPPHCSLLRALVMHQ